MTNDDEDRHVLAAAVRGNAELIVTQNTRHFPASACDPYGVEAIPADAFLCDLLDLNPPLMLEVLRLLERERRDLTVADILIAVSPFAERFARAARFELGLPVT